MLGAIAFILGYFYSTICHIIKPLCEC